MDQIRCSRPEVFLKKEFLEIPQNSQENTCTRVSFLIKLQASACNFIKIETLAQVFSCEFCEISKNTFSYRTPSVAASVKSITLQTHRVVVLIKFDDADYQNHLHILNIYNKMFKYKILQDL